MVKTNIYIFLLLILTSITPVIIAKENRKSINSFFNLLSENFHLNNAAVFIGYTVFDFNHFFLIMYVFSFVIYLIEHYFIIEDQNTGSLIKVIQITVLIIGIIGQVYCTYIILNPLNPASIST